jgi:hypothetical protein
MEYVVEYKIGQLMPLSGAVAPPLHTYISLGSGSEVRSDRTGLWPLSGLNLQPSSTCVKVRLAALTAGAGSDGGQDGGSMDVAFLPVLFYRREWAQRHDLSQKNR